MTMLPTAATARQLAVSLPVFRQMVAFVDQRRARKATLVASHPQMLQWRAEDAGRYGVIADIHPKDFIFQFILRSADPRSAVREYFDTGNSSANKLRALLFEDLGLDAKPVGLLEFASGYACVSRHLVKFSDDIALTVCDIHDEARAFYAAHLDMPFVDSVPVPEAFSAPGDFDAVFALSFFSHMPEETWARWLAALFRCVAPGGHLIFTTHGMVSREQFGNPKLSENGFRFVARSEQLDLAPDEYGGTITAPAFVEAAIAGLPDAKLALFREGEWWGHQDLYVVRKAAA